ncbi:MAG TPA: SRPBCC domain-containing protein [Gaiellaceae bacterium]|nr:SRPBCC domain-containing protein [Gaiellaceae bacterium]
MSTQAAGTEAIHRTVSVDCTVEHAFETFTDKIHTWWPLATHSIEMEETGSSPETVVFDGPGGRVYERTTKGEELEWAQVVAFEPPHRFVLAWNPSRDQGRPRTEIEVTFTNEDGRTRVDLEHRGWEQLGEQAAEVRHGYSQGWQTVLAGYAEKASS